MCLRTSRSRSKEAASSRGSDSIRILPTHSRHLACAFSKSIYLFCTCAGSEHGSHIGCHLRLLESHVFEEVTPDQLSEKVAQRTRATRAQFRKHQARTPKSHSRKF